MRNQVSRIFIPNDIQSEFLRVHYMGKIPISNETDIIITDISDKEVKWFIDRDGLSRIKINKSFIKEEIDQAGVSRLYFKDETNYYKGLFYLDKLVKV